MQNAAFDELEKGFKKGSSDVSEENMQIGEVYVSCWKSIAHTVSVFH